MFSGPMRVSEALNRFIEDYRERQASADCNHRLWINHRDDTEGWCRLCKKVVPCA